MIKNMIVKTISVYMVVLFALTMCANTDKIAVTFMRWGCLFYLVSFLYSNGYLKLKRGESNEE